MKSLNKKGWQFILLTGILSTVPYYFILSKGDSDSPWAMALMWSPAISALIMRLSYREGLFKGLVWNPLKDFKWLLAAAFVPLAIEILSLLITLLVNAGELKDGFITMEGGNISIKGVAMIFGTGSQAWYFFIANYALSFFIGTVIYSLMFALGEEYGWRGYLQKQWNQDNNLHGFVIIGIIWGLWHFPAILQGHNYPEYPILGAFILMPLLCTLFSIVFGLSFSRKHVIWIAVIFHGALNISSDISNTALIEDSINKPINDTIWTSLWLLTAILFWKKFKKQ
jgi:membrane protease YdiL (CAAX protease family)